jgi:hypothetical protein
MEHRPLLEANSHSPSQEITPFPEPRKLMKAYESSPLDPILKQMKPAHTFKAYILKIHLINWLTPNKC